MLMYADDTTLYCNIDNYATEAVINTELSKLCEWLGANKLSLNVAKTKFMVFHTTNRNVVYPRLHMNGNEIERVSQFNFLGLIVSANMSWNAHVCHISLKVAKSVGILYRLKLIYPHAILLTIYNALIIPHFNYCLLLWGAVLCKNHQLHLLQKRALRTITNSHYIAHTEPICRNLRLLKLPDMFCLAIWKFYYKLMKNMLPICFSFMKPTLPVICSRYEIRRPVFHLPAIKHKFEKQSL